MQALEAVATRPDIVKAFDGDRHNRDVLMDGENSGAFLENFRRTVDGALDFGIENKNLSALEAEGAGAHRGNQVGVGVDRDELHGARQPAHHPGSEDLACANVEEVFEDVEGKLRRYERAIEEALMVGRENERPGFGQLLEAGHFHAEEQACDRLDDAAEGKPEARRDGTLFRDGENFWIRGLDGEYLFPAG